MKRIIKIILCAIGGCSVFAMASCIRDTFTFSFNSRYDEPLEHPLSSWLSTDYPNDEIVFFITDSQKDILFRSMHKDSLFVEIMDEFVVEQLYSYTIMNDSEYVEVGSCDVYIWLRPSHVGNTHLHIHNSIHDTLLSVCVLPEYYTYTEPNLDFDDTDDSVRTKLLKKYSQYAYNTEDQYYQVGDSRCMFNLYVNYSNSGTVDNYVVDLYQSVASEELTGYIDERYYKTSAQSNGLPVYIRAFNISTTPSISDATLIVIPDIAGHKVTYKNPMTYSK